MQKQATLLDDEARQSQGREAIYESLSKELNIPVETLQAQQKSTNFGFGQLFIANSLAASSGKTFDQISGEFRAGQGWGEIAKANNLKLGKVVSGLKRTNQQMERVRVEREQASASRESRAGGEGRADSQGGAKGHAGQSAGPRGKR